MATHSIPSQAPGDLVLFLPESPITPFPLAPSLPHLKGPPCHPPPWPTGKIPLAASAQPHPLPLQPGFHPDCSIQTHQWSPDYQGNGPSSAECTAWPPRRGLSPSAAPPHPHCLLPTLTSCILCSPNHFLWLPPGCLWSWFFGGPSTPPVSLQLIHGLGAAGLGCISFLCCLVPGKSRGLGLQHNTLD